MGEWRVTETIDNTPGRIYDKPPMPNTKLDARRPWTIQDFIADGVNCPISAVRQDLQSLRRLQGLEWILLLVYQAEPYQLEAGKAGPALALRSRFFQSLAILAHSNRKVTETGIGEDVVDRISAGRLGPLPKGVVEPEIAKSLLKEHWWTLLTSRGMRELRAKWISGTSSMPPSIHTATATHVCLIYPKRISRLRQASVAVHGKFRQSYQSKGVSLPLRSASYSSLLSKISCSVPVVVNQELGRIKAAEMMTAYYEAQFGVDALVAASTSSADYEQYVKQFANSILKAALRLTGSSTGNIYLSTSKRQELDLVSEVNNKRAIVTMHLNEEESVVGFVFRTGKPLLINDLAEFSRTHPDVHYRWVGALKGKEPYAELAVPITTPNPESTTRHTIGVLNVEKVRPDDVGYYGAHDLTILRFLVLRFCIWRKSLASAMANRSLSEIAISTSIGATDHVRVPSAELVDNRIPKDYQSLQGQLLEVLTQAQSLTRSKTATIRLVSTDGAHLVRFCACPSSAMADPYNAIRLSRKDSVNAFVAQTGSVCDLRDIRDRSQYSRYGGQLNFLKARQDIRSEYCLPLCVRGRLVGTLNLESEFKDAFSGERHFLQAVRAQLELALYTAQSRYEQSVLSATARATLNTHELLKCAGELNRVAATFTSDAVPTLHMVETRIRACTMPTADRQFALAGGVSSSFKDIVSRLAVAKNVHRVIVWGEWRTISGTNPAPSITSTLSLVVSEVLDNSFLQATKVPGGHIRVSMQPQTLGGMSFDVIHVSHRVLYPVEDGATSSVYRTPIQKSDRPHIGAFLAGAMMRSIGGEITFWYNPNSKSVHTAIHIPATRNAQGRCE